MLPLHTKKTRVHQAVTHCSTTHLCRESRYTVTSRFSTPIITISTYQRHSVDPTLLRESRFTFQVTNLSSNSSILCLLSRKTRYNTTILSRDDFTLFFTLYCANLAAFVTSSNTHPPIDKASRVQLKTAEKDNLYTSESTPMVYHQLGRRRIQQAEQRCQDLTQSNSPLFTERCLQILR